MVHTAKFIIELTPEDITYISTKTPLRGELNQDTLGLSSIEAITLNIFKSIRKANSKELRINPDANYKSVWKAHMVVDFIKLLNRPDITESDITEITSKLEHYLSNFAISSEHHLELVRLDYRFDGYVASELERKILLKLYKKCVNKKQYMIKNTQYKTSVIYRSKSRKNNIYDKNTEREDKGMPIKKHEKNILRFEAQILNRHIYYNLKSKGLVKDFENYFSEDMYQHYMGQMIVQTLFRGNFYDIYRARQIINKSDLIKKPSEKEKILSFMVSISKERSVSKAVEKIGKYNYDKYIKILENVDVNPLLIPKMHKIQYIENPLKKLYESW